jgi:hypothetical protein
MPSWQIYTANKVVTQIARCYTETKNLPLLLAFLRRTVWLDGPIGRQSAGAGSHFLYGLPQSILRDQITLISHDAISMKYRDCVSVLLPALVIRDTKSHLLCTALYCIVLSLWPV